MRRDKYLWHDADWCLKCGFLSPTPRGNKIRPILCRLCTIKVRREVKKMNKSGVYATPQKPTLEEKRKETR